jgi:hypothetical protein
MSITNNPICQVISQNCDDVEHVLYKCSECLPGTKPIMYSSFDGTFNFKEVKGTDDVEMKEFQINKYRKGEKASILKDSWELTAGKCSIQNLLDEYQEFATDSEDDEANVNYRNSWIYRRITRNKQTGAQKIVDRRVSMMIDHPHSYNIEEDVDVTIKLTQISENFVTGFVDTTNGEKFMGIQFPKITGTVKPMKDQDKFYTDNLKVQTADDLTAFTEGQLSLPVTLKFYIDNFGEMPELSDNVVPIIENELEVTKIITTADELVNGFALPANFTNKNEDLTPDGVGLIVNMVVPNCVQGVKNLEVQVGRLQIPKWETNTDNGFVPATKQTIK